MLRCLHLFVHVLLAESIAIRLASIVTYRVFSPTSSLLKYRVPLFSRQPSSWDGIIGLGGGEPPNISPFEDEEVADTDQPVVTLEKVKWWDSDKSSMPLDLLPKDVSAVAISALAPYLISSADSHHQLVSMTNTTNQLPGLDRDEISALMNHETVEPVFVTLSVIPSKYLTFC